VKGRWNGLEGVGVRGQRGETGRKGRKKSEGGWKAGIKRVVRGRKRDEVEWNMWEWEMEREEGGWKMAEVGVEEGEGTGEIGTGEGDAGSAGQVREG
jgi:hypothetical protein